MSDTRSTGGSDEVNIRFSSSSKIDHWGRKSRATMPGKKAKKDEGAKRNRRAQQASVDSPLALPEAVRRSPLLPTPAPEERRMHGASERASGFVPPFDEGARGLVRVGLLGASPIDLHRSCGGYFQKAV